MTPRHLTIDEKVTKTYTSVENLNKALEKLGMTNEHTLLAYTQSGRVTAVFIGASNVPYWPHHGFMVVG